MVKWLLQSRVKAGPLLHPFRFGIFSSYHVECEAIIMRVLLASVFFILSGSNAFAAPLPGAELPVAAESGLIQVQSFSRTRKCQTVRNCNFLRNGEPRGCFSSYSCRRCRFVRVCRPRNRTTGTGRRCEYVSRCDWGGSV